MFVLEWRVVWKKMALVDGKRADAINNTMHFRLLQSQNPFENRVEFVETMTKNSTRKHRTDFQHTCRKMFSTLWTNEIFFKKVASDVYH